MAECDTNYLRIHKLFPRLREEAADEFVVRLGDSLAKVAMQVIERGPYTTLLRLVQLPLPAEAQAQAEPAVTPWWAAQPRLTVRLYHDARCAEVVDFQKARHFSAVYEYPNPSMRYPDEKAQVNRFLGEFLAQCLESGIVSEVVLSDLSPLPST